MKYPFPIYDAHNHLQDLRLASQRSSVIAARQQDYVQAARMLGGGNGRLMLPHILPHALAPVAQRGDQENRYGNRERNRAVRASERTFIAPRKSGPVFE